VIVTLSLSRHRKTDFERFEAYVLGRDEIINCVSTGGGSDYVMTVVTTSMAEFQELMETMLQADLLIERYMTYFATRLVKAEQPNLAKLVTQARKTP